MPLPRVRHSYGGFPDFKHLGLYSTDCRSHVNCLDLKAVMLALHHWAPLFQCRQVMIATDNTAVVPYISTSGGGKHSRSLLPRIVDIFLWILTGHSGRKTVCGSTLNNAIALVHLGRIVVHLHAWRLSCSTSKQ